jgi:hypothetical protein
MWLLMDPLEYQRLTTDLGWTADDYQHWFTQSTRRLLLADPPALRPGRQLTRLGMTGRPRSTRTT